MGRTACTEPQCLYKVDLYFYLTFNLNIYYIFPMLIRKLRIFRMKLNITARLLYVLVIEYSVISATIIRDFNLENQSYPRILLIFCL